MVTVIILFIFGLLCLVKGGDWFVDSAVEIAKFSGVSPVLIGATIVSIATTLPEIIVSSTAAIHGETTMSVGNAIGSIICNTGFVLAISALLGNIIIKDEHFKFKSITLISYILILTACSLDGRIIMAEAFVLIVMLIFYIYLSVRSINYKKKTKALNKESNSKIVNYQKIIIYFILGLILILLGSNFVIHYGVILAEYMNVPTAVISLTLIALGTSLPELTTGISSLVKGNVEIGLGNIIGANILDATMVIGVAGLFSELQIIPQNLTLDLPVALLVTLVLIIPSIFTKRVSNIQGFFLMAIYLAYIIYLWQRVL